MKFLKKIFGSKANVDVESLQETLESKIEGCKRPAVRLLKSSDTSKSKFGGKPLVEKNTFSWPMSDGKPMAFLAQIDLAEIAQVQKYSWLNDKGLLLFFYDVIAMPWGFDPKDRGRWSVLYQLNPDTQTEYPDEYDDELKVKEFYIKPTLVNILPDCDDPCIEELDLSEQETDLYIEMTESFSEPRHQVGGFPSPIQDNYMELESQLAANGVYVGDPDGYKSKEAKQLAPGASDWKLLLQFDTDEELNVMWGDCGMIYFWVQQQKSKLNEFDNSWLILQCG